MKGLFVQPNNLLWAGSQKGIVPFLKIAAFQYVVFKILLEILCIYEKTNMGFLTSNLFLKLVYLIEAVILNYMEMFLKALLLNYTFLVSA